MRFREADQRVGGRTAQRTVRVSSGRETSPLDGAAQLVIQVADAEDDLHGSAEYKEHLIGVLLRRALATAVGTLLPGFASGELGE